MYNAFQTYQYFITIHWWRKRSEGLFRRAIIVQFLCEQNWGFKIKHWWKLIIVAYWKHLGCTWCYNTICTFHVTGLVHDIYTICTLHVTGLVHDIYTICTLHVTGLVYDIYTIWTLHVTIDPNNPNWDCRQRQCD